MDKMKAKTVRFDGLLYDNVIRPLKYNRNEQRNNFQRKKYMDEDYTGW